MITLYSKPGCQPCRLTKKKLEKLGLEYTEISVVENEEAISAVRALGFSSLPVVITAEKSWSGYNPDRLAELA